MEPINLLETADNSLLEEVKPIELHDVMLTDHNLVNNINNLTFLGSNGESVTISFSNGNVSLSEKLTNNEAAKLFWDHVTRLNPHNTETTIQSKPTVDDKVSANSDYGRYAEAMKVVR